MKQHKFLPIGVLGALVLAVLFGFGVYRSVNAAYDLQTTPPPASATAVPSTDTGAAPASTGKPARTERGLRGPGEGQADEYLANALGITVDELNTAYTQARSAALAQAVTDGLITQAQADELSARGGAFPFGGHWGGWLKEQGVDLNQHLAAALGISVDALEQAFTAAQNARLDQAVADGMLTQEQADLMKAEHALVADDNYQSSMQSAFEAAVQQAVSSSVITQAQADQILQNTAGQSWGLPGRGGKGGPGGPGGQGGRGGGHRGAGFMPGQPDMPAAP